MEEEYWCLGFLGSWFLGFLVSPSSMGESSRCVEGQGCFGSLGFSVSMLIGFLFCRFKVSRFFVLFVCLFVWFLDFEDYLVSGFQRFSASWFQSFKVYWLQSFKDLRESQFMLSGSY